MPESLFVLSTVGTSLLTNGADAEIVTLLRRTANLTERELLPADRAAINRHAGIVAETMRFAGHEDLRAASAEINGILAYQELHPQRFSSRGMHVLLTTDTVQGALAAQIVTECLQRCGLGDTQVYAPQGLSTKSRVHFTAGMVAVVNWCEAELPAYRDAEYRIVFNLTGGFKSVQGYLNTLGMLYADELIYLFEPPSRELITIPRLPVRLDALEIVRRYAVSLGMLDETEMLPTASLPDLDEIHELFIDQIEVDGVAYAALSPWGTAIWKQHYKAVYGEKLQPWPGLRYDERFRKDFEEKPDPNLRAQLQTALARVAAVLGEAGGDVSALMRDGGVQYEHLKHAPPFDSIRVTQGVRVGCRREADGLTLVRFGIEGDVYPDLERRSRQR